MGREVVRPPLQLVPSISCAEHSHSKLLSLSRCLPLLGWIILPFSSVPWPRHASSWPAEHYFLLPLPRQFLLRSNSRVVDGTGNVFMLLCTLSTLVPSSSPQFPPFSLSPPTVFTWVGWHCLHCVELPHATTFSLTALHFQVAGHMSPSLFRYILKWECRKAETWQTISCKLRQQNCAKPMTLPQRSSLINT